jgi:hypothetical protein
VAVAALARAGAAATCLHQHQQSASHGQTHPKATAKENDMHVKIGDTLYDANVTPIMLVLSDVDREQIAAMPLGLHKFCVYPSDKFTAEQIDAWMNAPETPKPDVTVQT